MPEKLRYLVSVDTNEIPGKAVLKFVEFSTEIVDLNDRGFRERQFNLVDPRHPDVIRLKSILTRPKGKTE